MAQNKFRLTLEGQTYDIERRDALMVVNGVEFACEAREDRLLVAGNPHQVALSPGTAEVDGIRYAIAAEGLEEPRAPQTGRRAATHGAGEEAGAILAIMPGLIIKVLKQVGDRVQAGETVFILEAMKMQNELQARTSGVLRQLKVKSGDTVEMRQVLAIIE